MGGRGGGGGGFVCGGCDFRHDGVWMDGWMEFGWIEVSECVIIAILLWSLANSDFGSDCLGAFGGGGWRWIDDGRSRLKWTTTSS
mmetsp:Transcript_12794/g.26058  ORF Transcript_12794/g.26058 Transcript_12794/m.26058 type:complete len:85 (+) Transcript_12794:117-371(+)